MPAVAVVALALCAAGCGAAGAAQPPADAPTVVTGVWALAQIAAAVGGGALHVVDVVPPGTDPMAPLDAAEAAQVRAADVVVEVGGGYQPSLAAAASGDAHVVTVASSAQAADDGPWLDPADLDAVASRLAAVLATVAPAGSSTWSNGARDQAAEDSSLSADLHDSLSDCPRTTIVTPDRTFVDLADADGVTDRVVGAPAAPTGTQVAAATRVVEAARVTTVFSEPWVPAALVTAAARAAGAKVKSLDPLVGQPAGGYPRGATYSDELEEDLGALTAALSCPQMGQN